MDQAINLPRYEEVLRQRANQHPQAPSRWTLRRWRQQYPDAVLYLASDPELFESFVQDVRDNYESTVKQS